MLQPDRRGILGTILLLVSFVAVVVMWALQLEPTAWLIITIMALFVAGVFLAIDDRRPQ